MAGDVMHLLRQNPQIIIFIALALGYFVGKRLKIFGFTLGTTASILLIALVVGQVGIKVPPLVKNISFALFIFTVGYKVGPQFFGALKKEGIHYLWIALVVAFTALATAIGMGKALNLDKGTTAGMFAGAMTTSAAIGTGEGAIRQLDVPEGKKDDFDSNLAVAYAITYIFGTAGTIILLKLAPGLLRIDLKAEAKKLAAQMGAAPGEGDDADTFSWTKRINMRAYTALNEAVVGKTVSQIEGLFRGKAAIHKIGRGTDTMKAGPDTQVARGDTLLLFGASTRFIGADELIGPEVDRSTVTDVSGETLKVCILNKGVVGKTLGQLGGERFAHGVFLLKATRQGQKLPLLPATKVHKCDVLEIIGAKDDVERVAQAVGYAERPSPVTDLATVMLGCTLGTLIGLIVIPVFGMPVTLGTGGGILVAGLLCGWLRAVRPTFGHIPNSVQWIMSDLGLNLFVACVGVSAGPQALMALKTTGLAVFLGGVTITVLPIITCLFVGLKVLKMNPVLLFGAATGSHNCTASLHAVTDVAESPLPVLGYAAPYAFANVLLTVWGSVLVNVM